MNVMIKQKFNIGDVVRLKCSKVPMVIVDIDYITIGFNDYNTYLYKCVWLNDVSKIEHANIPELSLVSNEIQ